MTQPGPALHATTARAARSAVLAAAGLAGAASLVAFAAPAHAAPAPAAPAKTPADDATATKSQAPKRTLAADFGNQKLRVGIEPAKGAVDAEGKPLDTLATAGTTLRVTGNGPQGASGSFDCKTVDTTPGDPTDPTFCEGNLFNQNPFDNGGGTSPMRRANVVSPSPDGPLNLYNIPAGWTATVEQISPLTGLRKAPPETLPTCTVESDNVNCTETLPGSQFSRTKSTDVVLVAPGIPPVARDDSADTTQGTAVTIDISDNDTGNAPIDTVELAKKAGHGTVAFAATDDGVTAPATGPTGAAGATGVTGPTGPTTTAAAPGDVAGSTVLRATGQRRAAALGSYRAIYTPAAGFSGTDRFTYRITTANGSATAVVTVRVAAAPASSTTAGPTPTTERDPIAETGTDSGELLLVGAGLLAAGAVATTAGVRRRRGRHAR